MAVTIPESTRKTVLYLCPHQVDARPIWGLKIVHRHAQVQYLDSSGLPAKGNSRCEAWFPVMGLMTQANLPESVLRPYSVSEAMLAPPYLRQGFVVSPLLIEPFRRDTPFLRCSCPSSPDSTWTRGSRVVDSLVRWAPPPADGPRACRVPVRHAERRRFASTLRRDALYMDSVRTKNWTFL